MGSRARRMYDYHTWANRRVFARLRELPASVYHEPIPSVFPSIHQTMLHMYGVDQIWLGVLRQESSDIIHGRVRRLREELAAADLATMEERFRALQGEYEAFLDGQPDLEQVVPAEHPRYGRQEFRMADIVHHVVNHGTYHRGNVTAMLRQLGHPGISTDYVFFLMETGRGMEAEAPGGS